MSPLFHVHGVKVKDACFCFVDIGGIVDHHCLSFFVIIAIIWYYIILFYFCYKIYLHFM